LDQNLKQRLVGALVLLSLAVIFLPLVFNGQQEQINPADYEYPEQPALTIQSLDFTDIEADAREAGQEVAAVESSKQSQDQVVADHAADDPESQPQLQAVATPEPVTAAQPKDPVADYIQQERAADTAIQQSGDNAVSLADAWIIQVGAFSSRANADGLRDKLIAAGYKAYTKAVSGLYKVYVGPEIRRTRLEQQKSSLERDFKLKALILKYIP